MQKYELNYEFIKPQKVLDFLCAKYDSIPYSVFLTMLKNKDIRINGNKINKNIVVNYLDKITFFVSDKLPEKKFYEIVYEDDNILVVNKFKNIEVCDGDRNLVELLSKENKKVFAVHRIDRNTTGLVIFAKTKDSKKELEDAFKEHKVYKTYLTEVIGTLKEKEKTLTAYLVKDKDKSLVKIFANKKENSQKIITKYKVVKESGNTSVLEVEIPTGRTHQIRAHLSHIGHAVIGDDKYGNYEDNRKYKERTQKLVAYKLTFDLDTGSLSYLNNKEFKIKTFLDN